MSGGLLVGFEYGTLSLWVYDNDVISEESVYGRGDFDSNPAIYPSIVFQTDFNYFGA